MSHQLYCTNFKTFIFQMVNEILGGIDDEDIREYIMGVMGEDPKFLALVAARERRYRTPLQPNWCKCGHCRPMNTAIEHKCCRVATCRTLQHTIRQVCLDSTVVKTPVNANCDTFMRIVSHDNRAMRLAAYRQFVVSEYEHLGRNNRVVIPSCIVWLIRDKWPSTDGKYTGFKPAKQRK